MEEASGFAGFFGKRSIPAERLIVAWILIIAAVGVGAFCLYLGFTAPPDKAAEAIQLRWYGFGFFGFALLMWLVHRLIAWILDR